MDVQGGNQIPTKLNITLLRLVVNNPKMFYPQDWYYDEEFANAPDTDEFSAVMVVHRYLQMPQTWYGGKGTSWLAREYVWTINTDDEGMQVYVGGWDLGKRHKGLQIHRHLTLHPEMFLNNRPTLPCRKG